MGRSTPSICSTLLSLTYVISAALGQTVTGQLGNAIENLKNPTGAAYIGVLNSPTIKGRIIAVDAQEKGTEFSVMFTGLPKEGGPFGYHVHVMPVEADGNCTKTLAHLDPFVRGEVTPCMKDRPETCQVGDLAGKHGPMKPAGEAFMFEASYTDPYVSMTPGMGSFFGNRSFVIHMADKTRIACANFLPADQAFSGMAGMPPTMMPPPGMIPGMPSAPPVVPGTVPPAASPAVPPAGGIIPGMTIPGMPGMPGMPQVPGMPPVEVPPAAQPSGQRGGKGQGRGGKGGRGQGGMGGGRGGGGGGGEGGRGGGGRGFDVDDADTLPGVASATPGLVNAPKDQAANNPFPGGNMPVGSPQQIQGSPGGIPPMADVARQGSAAKMMTFSMSALAAVFFVATVAL